VNLLLDTRVFLWWDRQDMALNADTRAVIADPSDQIFVSAASIWEIAIKRQLRKLDFRGSAVAASANGFLELAILPIDAENAGGLAWQHNDPFDRMLVAQARRLTFTLATADVAIRAYPNVAQVWAGRARSAA
jgi:PIN domain nuclease of toxin-antitoxin system